MSVSKLWQWRLTALTVAVLALVAATVGYRSGGDSRDGAAVEAGTDERTVETGSGTGGSTDGTGSSADAGGALPFDGGIPPRPVLARVAEDGTLVRAVEWRWQGAPAPEGDAWWATPPECQAIGSIDAGFVTPQYVAMGWGEIFTRFDGTAALWGAGWTGHPQLGAILFGVVRTGDVVAEVRLLHDGVIVDRMAPVDGWAVLAWQLPPATSALAVDETGEVTAVSAGRSEVGRWDTSAPENPYSLPECQPPAPPVPEGVRPADAADAADAAAVEAIGAAFDAAFAFRADDPGDPRPQVQQGDALDDTFLGDLRDRTAEFGIDSVAAVVERVGFIDDATALVVFRLDGAALGWQYGEAVRDDDRWLVSSQTWCAIVEQAGVTCPAGLRDPALGPSRFDPYAIADDGRGIAERG